MKRYTTQQAKSNDERYVHCVYCNHEVEAGDVEEKPAPAVGDDLAWEKLAKDHAKTCEWIGTRAFRR